MFLKQVLPSQGLYCVATKLEQGFKHTFFDTIEEAESFALEVDRSSREVYIAQASYLPAAREAALHNRGLRGGSKNPDWKRERVRANVAMLRSFFLDIDCGEGKPYATHADAIGALKSMLAETGLPNPSVVFSGGGLYAYWSMSQDMLPSVWYTVAVLLKNVLAAYAFEFDPVRTADMASVLRPPGAHNKKAHVGGREVKVLAACGPHPLEEFVGQLEAAAKRRSLSTNISAPPKSKSEWDDYNVFQSVSSDPIRIAEKCGQIAKVRASQGNVSEPLWYAAIGVLRYAENGNDIIHDWSAGHPSYSAEDTDRKIQQHELAGVAPTTCAHFGSTDPSGCLGCRYKDKIRSPIVLGRPEAVQTTVEQDDTVCLPNPPYVRAEDGLYVQEEDLQFKFYDLDLYPIRIAYDESLGYEVTTFRHTLPHDGVHEFTLRSSLVNDHRGLMTALWDNHVHVTGKKEKGIMLGYIESYTQKLQRQRKMSRLLCQMGWKEINGMEAFVLGKKIFYADGSIDEAALAQNVPAAAAAYSSVGDIQKWIATTEPFDTPGSEPFAFALLAGAFGAPLMKFTGYEGAVLSMVGRSGIGKTLVTRMVQSVYGEERRLMMLKDDTRNSLIARLGVYGSLPLTIDEVTNIDAAELSDLVYRITQGRDKARLTKNAQERANLNQWHTLALVSSNSSLVERLTGHKLDASAEVNRVFEYHVYPAPALNRQVCTEIYRTIQDNYGHVGEEYIKYLVTHTAEHQMKMDQLVALVEQKAKISSDDRFWGAVLAAAIYGGMIASHLGLIRFNVSRVLQWGIEQLMKMKTVRVDQTIDAVSFLGLFMDEHIFNRLVVEAGARNARVVNSVIEEPKARGLFVRLEVDTRRGYISRDRLKEYARKRSASYSAVRDELLLNGILIDPNKRKVLGAGTGLAGAMQPCWEFDLAAPALGSVGASLNMQLENAKATKEEDDE